MPHQRAVDVRDATEDDLPAIRRVAATVGEDHEWGGGDGRYVGHLLATGRVVVATRGGAVVGYAAARTLPDRAGRGSMLCDLFVEPAAHGTGCGRALLDALWRDDPVRMTFSSLHPHALPLYTSFGLGAWWPLLYLDGPSRTSAVEPALRAYAVDATSPEEAVALDRSWTGVDRSADYAAWADRPAGVALTATLGGAPVAVGAAGGAGAGFALERLTLAPASSDAVARDAVLAVTRWLSRDRPVHVRIPAPHPAARAVLAAGWRVTTYDLFMATAGDLLDPRRSLPSPALG